MNELAGTVALVTGASRGVGRGVVLALAQQGAAVYFTGRTVQEGEGTVRLPGSLQRTEQDARAQGGTATGLQCDHTDDDQTRAVIERIQHDHGRLDLLVNNVWGGYEHYFDGTPFWEERGFWTEPLNRWDRMFQAGVRAHYVTSSLAVPLLLRSERALVATISFIASGRVDMGVAYGAAKAADDHMTACMAHELQPHGVAALALHPGLVRTEGVVQSGAFDLSTSHSPELVGLVISALLRDPQLLQRSGQALAVLRLAGEYGLSDLGGQPLPVE
ncbi:SDR family NAD(P)-dependent oxidoreductase [Deinococcus sonorensis]|uniref:SDR family NAD(P)-dependent oxidoreductase n=2 Tax=Deinococcus sonorensis TaxID=309891 RepID=A0AAU7U7W4_9DEIO